MTCELVITFSTFKVPKFYIFFVYAFFKDVSRSKLILIDRISLNILGCCICSNRGTRWTYLLNVERMFVIIIHSRNVILFNTMVATIKLRGRFSEKRALIQMLCSGPLFVFLLKAPFDKLSQLRVLVDHLQARVRLVLWFYVFQRPDSWIVENLDHSHFILNTLKRSYACRKLK